MKAALHAAAMALTGLLAGCGSAPPRPTPGPVPVVQASAAPAPSAYLLSAGDELDIRVPDAAQYDQSVRVRPDGKVTLNVIGTVHVQGRSPEDVQALSLIHI